MRGRSCDGVGRSLWIHSCSVVRTVEEGEEEVDLYTTMDEEEASDLYQDLLGV